MKLTVLSLGLVLLASCDQEIGGRSKGGAKTGSLIQGLESDSAASINSHLFRIAGTTRLSSQGETAAANSLPVGYSDIPMLMLSDDGILGDSVSRSTRPITECGVDPAMTTIAQRIRDCATKNPTQSEWNGVENATAGEGNWKLVARTTSNNEIWLDETTGFMWGPLLAASNWCQAASNLEGPLTDGGLSCLILNGGINRCEGAGYLGIPTSQISWRLPTRGDFLQADLDGARFVLPQATLPVWTATLDSSNRENAWSIIPQIGVLSSQPRSAEINVRCLGRRTQ